MKFLILVLFLITSCAQTPKQNKVSIYIFGLNFLVDQSKSQQIKKALESEISYIETIAEDDFKSEIKNLLNYSATIDYQNNNCSVGQVACSSGSYPRTIFINDYFFTLTSIEQFTSLLHEARHLESNNFEHKKCIKKAEWGYECDEGINSPYGIEYKYLLHKYMKTKDDNIAQLLLKIQPRLNNF